MTGRFASPATAAVLCSCDRLVPRVTTAESVACPACGRSWGMGAVLIETTPGSDRTEAVDWAKTGGDEPEEEPVPPTRARPIAVGDRAALAPKEDG